MVGQQFRQSVQAREVENDSPVERLSKSTSEPERLSEDTATPLLADQVWVLDGGRIIEQRS